MTKETVISHLEKIVEDDNTIDINYIVNHLSQKKLDSIQKAIQTVKDGGDGTILLSPVKSIVGANVSFVDIRIVRLVMKKAGLI
jgi:hypothetical protein